MRIFLAALLFFPQILKAVEELNAPEVKKEELAYYAILPYVNYDTTQFWSFGLAAEKESEIDDIDTYLIDLEVTQKSRIRLSTRYSFFISSDWKTTIRADVTNFYDPFYGLGMSTKTENLQTIKQRVISSQLDFSYVHSPSFYFGPFVKYNQRIERPDYQIDNHRFFPNETSLSFGGTALYDTRDSKFNPHSGNKHELSLSIVPDGLNSLEHVNTFSNIKIDLRKYFPIYGSVLATRFTAGTTIGEPSYLYKYRLGGIDLLRGYQTNRFIGNNLASVQLEERINLYKEYIALTGSYEAGSINSSPFSKIHSSKGIGLRVAMPPDWTNILTINFGYGDDQNNASLEFNENF